MSEKITSAVARMLGGLDLIGLWLGLLTLRVVLGWEYFESGLEKFRGENWFMDIQDRFPFPFSIVPPEISWQMATWFELLGGVALAIGLATRFFSASLIVLTVVAILSVHWPAEWSTWSELLRGYTLSDQGFGNYKLAAIFIAMLVPLLLCGPGRLSIDHWVRRQAGGTVERHTLRPA
jgi:putative oxidoreductase